MFDIKDIYRSLKRQFSIYDVMIVITIIIVYFLTRVTHLTILPIFSDEGIYIRWAKVAWHDASWRFISLTDGRQPLQTWGTIPFLKVFYPNALYAGRMFSVATGFIGLTGIFSFCMYLWGKKAAFLASLLYILLPSFLFYDRIALVDSAVNAGFVWMLFLTVKLATERKLETSLILGLSAGLALLAKSSSRLFLLIAATAPIMYLPGRVAKVVMNTINYYILLGCAIFLALVIYNVQRLSPFFHYVAMKNNTFVMSFDEFKSTPFEYIRHNLKIFPLYISWEAGWLIVPLAIAGLYVMFKKDRQLSMLLMMYIILPFIAIGFFAKVLFPRYLLFYSTILVISAVYFFKEFSQTKIKITILGILLASLLFLDYPVLFDPVHISFPEVDRGQYIEGVTAVWGAENLMQYVREKSTKKPVILLAEGNFGLVADVLDVYLRGDDKIEIKGEWPLELRSLNAVQDQIPDKYVYAVFSHRSQFPSDWPITLVKKYEKPVGDKALYLFEVRKISE